MWRTILMLCCCVLVLLVPDNGSVTTKKSHAKPDVPKRTLDPRIGWAGFTKTAMDTIDQTLSNRKCKDGLNVKEMKSLLRSAYYKTWTVNNFVKLFDNDRNCTYDQLKKIFNYAPWPWWEKLISYCKNDNVHFKEMKEITECTDNRKFLQFWYFSLVESNETRCDVNQLVALLRYKTKVPKYRTWRYDRPFFSPLTKAICDRKDRRATYNLRVVLQYEYVLETHPSQLVNMFKYCTSKICHPWTVRDVLLWLENCTRFVDRENCSRSLCQIMDLANRLKCEPYPCLRNCLIIASKYNQTQDELVKIFKRMIKKRTVRLDIETFYDTFEKTLIYTLFKDNPEKLKRVTPYKWSEDNVRSESTSADTSSGSEVHPNDPDEYSYGTEPKENYSLDESTQSVSKKTFEESNYSYPGIPDYLSEYPHQKVDMNSPMQSIMQDEYLNSS